VFSQDRRRAPTDLAHFLRLAPSTIPASAPAGVAPAGFRCGVRLRGSSFGVEGKAIFWLAPAQEGLAPRRREAQEAQAVESRQVGTRSFSRQRLRWVQRLAKCYNREEGI
jgi:hypothetical protein